MKRTKIIYWIFTVLFSLSIISGAAMYILNNDYAVENFGRLGFPTWLVYPLAIAKIIGIIGVLQNKSKAIKEWAYAAFFFNLLLAFGAHIAVNDGEAFGPILVMSFLFGSYFFNKKL